MKKCSVCGVDKFPEEFHSERRVHDGLAACCRRCIKAIRKGRHKKRTSAKEPPHKMAARKMVKNAVKRGELIKPECCQSCQKPTPRELLDGHHEDYAKPLDVTWLCRECHGLEAMAAPARRAEQRRLRLLERPAA